MSADFSPLVGAGAARNAAPADSASGKRLEKVARQFQALFLMELMKPMTESLGKSSLTGEDSSATNDMYSWFWSEGLAAHLGNAWPMPALPGQDSAASSPSSSLSSTALSRASASGGAGQERAAAALAPAPSPAGAVRPSEATPPKGLAVQSAPDKPADWHGRLEALINSAGRLFQVPVNLVRAMVSVESSGRSDAVSNKGAVGLLQLMPATAREMGVKDPKDPWQNLLAGAKYMSRQLDRFGDVELALAAYNAGPSAVDRHNGVPPYAETRAYVRRVLEAKARLDQSHPQDA